MGRNESGVGLGDSPMASPFARSPPTSSSGLLLNRHAFTAVDHGAADIDNGGGNNLLCNSNSSNNNGNGGGYHNHLQNHSIGHSLRNTVDTGFSGRLNMSPSIYPIGNGNARSIPRNNDLLGRSFRSSSFMNEPLSPLAAFANATEYAESHTPTTVIGGGPLGSPMSTNNGGGLAALGGRLRSNSHLQSPSLAGLSSEIEAVGIQSRSLMHDSPFMIDRQLSGYSLTDMDSPSHEQLHVSNSGIWDPYNSPLGADSGRDHDSRNSYGFSLGGQHLSGQRLGAGTLNQQQQQQQQNWPRSPRTALQGSGQGSPFASAFTGIGGEPRGIALPPLASAGHLFADSTKPGAIGQKLQRSHLSTLSTPTDANGAYNNRDQARSAFSGFNASGSAASIAGKNSHNVSSTSSDNYDEVFELEQDVPMQVRDIGGSTHVNSSVASNPQFIPMEG
ncbi:hypothetical protein GGF37_006765, partial [Kickxella alabastrina]